MSLVLVTGGTGFVGLHLVEALIRRGDQVRALVRPGSPATTLRALGAEIVSGEISDLSALTAAMSGVSVVHHVAGIIRAFRPADFYEVNQKGTAKVAEACAAQSSPPRLVI